MKGKWRYSCWSISAKAMTGCIALTLMVALFVGVFAYDLSYRYMQDASLQELFEQATEIAARVPETTGRLKVPTREDIELYQQLTNARVLFVQPDYVALRLPKESNRQEYMIPTQISDAMDQQFIARILVGETVMEARWFTFTRGKMLFVGVPLKNAYNNIVGALILVQPIEQLGQMGQMMRAGVTRAAIIALVLAGLLSWKLSQTLIKPILQITQAAKRVSEGEYRTRVELRTNDEIGELASTLNLLSARLGDVIDRMREERDQLETIVGSIDEGIVAVDSAGNVVRFNQAFLELMEIADAKSLEQTDDGVMRILNGLLRDSMFSRKRQRGSWVNPSRRNIAAVASPRFGKRREILGSVALLQDVSEAERLEQMRRDYVANISHELRTPLTGIRGMVEPLMDGYIDTEEERKDCYSVIYRETIRLEKMIGEMLDVSRLQAGRVTLEAEQIEAHGIVEQALRRVRPTAESAGITLLAELADEEIACMGNEDRALQVLTIFLDNALSFTPSGGSVTAYARNERDCVRLGVIDTGVGIEAKDLPFIWERFYKSDKSRMRTSGTGLGLAIAKLVVELMGGEIGVNTQLGKGSEFFFTLKKE